jgi:hypothetical protein
MWRVNQWERGQLLKMVIIPRQRKVIFQKRCPLLKNQSFLSPLVRVHLFKMVQVFKMVLQLPVQRCSLTVLKTLYLSTPFQ